METKPIIDAVTCTNQYRLPATGEKVTIRGLVSASQHNGKQGIVKNYDLKSRRYHIQPLDSGDGNGKNHKHLAIKPENILLSEEEDSDPIPWDDTDLLVHVFIPCHVTIDARRLELFRQCARSLIVQTASRFQIFVGVSGDNEAVLQSAMDILQLAAVKSLPESKPNQWFANPSPSKESQFQHFKNLLPLSVALDPDAWLMFLDNDDMYHPFRVQWFQRNVMRFRDNPSIDGFYAGGKLLIDEKMCREKFGADKVPSLELFINKDDSLDGLVDVAATYSENADKDTLEYFDFCVRSSVLERFLSLTPCGVLDHSFCDIRFSEILNGLAIMQVYHPTQEWLLMHYRLRQWDRHELMMQRDLSRPNGMMSVRISDEDRALSEETGLDVGLIVYCRRDCEEGAIQMVGRDEIGLEHRRKLVVPNVDAIFGHGIGSRIWSDTCTKFLSHFDENNLHKNELWAAESKTRTFNLEQDTNYTRNF